MGMIASTDNNTGALPGNTVIGPASLIITQGLGGNLKTEKGGGVPINIMGRNSKTPSINP
jgi:hypothetical protein